MTAKKKITKTNSKKKKSAKPKKAIAKPSITEVTSDDRLTILTETNRQLKRKIFDLYTIFEISRNFNTVQLFDQLLDTFIFTSLAQVSAAKAAVYLKSIKEKGLFKLIKHRGSGEIPHGNLRFPASSKLIEHITKLNRPASTLDVMDGIANNSEKKIISKFSPGLIVPLMFQNDLSGLLLISDKISSRDFTNDDIEFLSILASQISVAIENTRLYEAERNTSQQLRKTQQQLVQSERLAALGEMSAKVAHEVNNPLGIIKNYLLLLNKELEPKSKGTNYSNIISGELNRIASIIRELLDFYRPQKIKFEKVNICDIIKNTLELMAIQLSTKKIKVVKLFSPNCPKIDCLPDHLKQVFLNLIINAYDVMDERGTLEITTEYEDNNIIIIFKDTGPGIPPGLIPRIFEPFFTTKDFQKGTGLGLSVCYGIIKNHNGSITYKNYNNGGCFSIKLPKINKLKNYEPSI